MANSSTLTTAELTSNVGVVLFGAIETTEALAANALWYLLSDPPLTRSVERDRSLVPSVVEEALRIEPGAAVIDRYATRRTTLGDATIAAGDLVRISLLGANRDPAEFDEPDEFRLDRPNVDRHLAFVQGPHACLGPHLARVEARAVVEAVLDLGPALTLDLKASRPPRGLIFRKPPSVVAHW